MNPRVTVLYVHPGGNGWYQIQSMAHLLAATFEAPLWQLVDPGHVSLVKRLAGELPRRRARGGSHAIVIVPNPAQLVHIASWRHWFPGFASVRAWVIDSFWDERIPRMARRHNHLDKVWITDGELVESWEGVTGTPVGYLPWGTDVLGLGPVAGERPVDLQRVGRQPASWDDDTSVGALAAERGVVFRGRPAFGGSMAANQASVFGALAAAKYVLAFSNRHSPADYTHPTREYLTGRWLDALAAGACVAGLPPETVASRQLLWGEGLLSVPADDASSGLDIVADAVRAWTPDMALHNRALARRRLDWRWRFSVLADEIGWRPARLDDDLAALARVVE